MADRWVVVVRLTVLLSGMLPVAAASAQSPPTRSNPLREGVLTSATAPASRSSKSKKSPLQRFMSKGDDGAASAGKPLSAQSSLQPLGPGWLKDGVPELLTPSQTAAPVDDLLPENLEPDLLSAPHEPLIAPPETLGSESLSPESVPSLLGPDSLAPGSLTPDSFAREPLTPGAMPGSFSSSSGGLMHDLLSGPALPAVRQPMLRESWLYRPFNLSIFEGALFASPPIGPQINTTVAYFTGFRLGWDYATHFGGETRFAFSKVFLLDSQTRSTEVGYQRLFYFDTNVLVYPWGDTRFRPFFSLGGGLADILVVSNNGLRLHPGAFNLPFGAGIKYRHGTRLAFRADIRDNLTFSGSGGMRTLNNIEVVGGVEFHFGGGDRRTYWPWNPSRHWW